MVQHSTLGGINRSTDGDQAIAVMPLSQAHIARPCRPSTGSPVDRGKSDHHDASKTSTKVSGSRASPIAIDDVESDGSAIGSHNSKSIKREPSWEETLVSSRAGPSSRKRTKASGYTGHRANKYNKQSEQMVARDAPSRPSSAYRYSVDVKEERSSSASRKKPHVLTEAMKEELDIDVKPKLEEGEDFQVLYSTHRQAKGEPDAKPK
jgi:hypothetical protein